MREVTTATPLPVIGHRENAAHQCNGIDNPHVLYLASAGLDDPLIVSQVLRYLTGLAPLLSGCHLVTFERRRWSEAETTAAHRRLRKDGIQWHPVRSSRVFRAASLWADLWVGVREVRRIAAAHPVNVIHARSFVAGQIGRIVKRRTGLPLLYDMRGLWTLEKRAKGTIRNRFVGRLAERMEERLFREADHIVSLTHAGYRYLRDRGVSVPIEVIPTCVDLGLFRPTEAFNNVQHAPPCRFISVGSLGPGYLAEGMFAMFKSARQRFQQLKLEILTATPQARLQEVAHRMDCPLDGVLIERVDPSVAPSRIAAADVGLCFIERSEAKIASCPTKIGEYLACGLPVIANAGIGDVDGILEEHRVGVVVRSLDEAGLRDALDRLAALRADPSLGSRCRRTAEELFSLDKGVAAYRRLYETLTIKRL